MKKTLMCGFFTAIQSKQILRIRNLLIRYKISVDQRYLESQLGVVVELIAVCDCARSLITGNGISEIWNKKTEKEKTNTNHKFTHDHSRFLSQNRFTF